MDRRNDRVGLPGLVERGSGAPRDRAQEDPEVLGAVLATTLVVPDGQPLVWALRALGHQTATRVYGPKLMARYCEHAAQAGTPIYLYGGRNDAALVELSVALRSTTRDCRSPVRTPRRFTS